MILRSPILFVLLCTSWLQAGIVWEKTEIEVTPKKGETKIAVPFFFEVQKGQPVELLDVGSACGCTVTKIEKRMYSPEETGFLEVVFTPGQRQGKQIKAVEVKTVEAGVETLTKLTLMVNLPELAKVEKSLYEWARGDTEPKDIKIALGADVTVALSAETPIAPKLFNVELSTDAEGKAYTLRVTPVMNVGDGIMPLNLDILISKERVSMLNFILIKR